MIGIGLSKVVLVECHTARARTQRPGAIRSVDVPGPARTHLRAAASGWLAMLDVTSELIAVLYAAGIVERHESLVLVLSHSEPLGVGDRPHRFVIDYDPVRGEQLVRAEAEDAGAARV